MTVDTVYTDETVLVVGVLHCNLTALKSIEDMSKTEILVYTCPHTTVSHTLGSVGDWNN
jgi:hypothetical protein